MKHVTWAVVSLLLLAVPALADDPMVNMPPDIAAIIAKMKAGQRPTPDDLAKLQAWQRGVVDRANVPIPGGAGSGAAAGPAQPEGIPCKIHVTLEYTAKQGSVTETGHVDAYTDSMLYAKLGGNGDYSQNMLNPDAAASSFRFMPIMPPPGATKRPEIGSGMGRFAGDYPGSRSSRRAEGSLTRVAFGAMLTTTGKGDALFASGAGITAQLDGTGTNTDPSGTHSSAVHGDDAFGEVLGSLAAPFVDEQRHPMQGGKPTPAPTMQLSYKALSDAIVSGKTSTVNGTEHFSFTDNGKTYTGSSSIAITLRPKPLQLVIEPADDKVFQDWVPMPDDSDEGAKPEYFGHPKPLAIHIVLNDPRKTPAKSPGPTKPSADVGGPIDVYLREVSQYPGMTMNYPGKHESNTKPDLYFLPQMQQPKGVVWDDEAHVHTASTNAVEITVLVAARDTGAYGKVEAEIKELGVTSYDPHTTTKSLTLPLDDNHNHIADHWEKDKDVAIYDEHLTQDWDEEDKPYLKAQKGDGLALIDEYRGFVFAEEGSQASFQRLSPNKKKLFVMPLGKDREAFHAGAGKYEDITHIKLLYTRAEFAESWQQGLHIIRWINFNATPWTTPASAVRIEDKSDAKDVTGGGPGKTHFVDLADSVKASNAAETPQQTDFINVSRKQCGKLIHDISWVAINKDLKGNFKKGADALHLDLGLLKPWTDYNNESGLFPVLVEQCIVFTTTHELGHATGANHHGLGGHFASDDAAYSSGAKSCPMRYWHADEDTTEKLLWLFGRWDPSATAASGAQWTFCTGGPDNDWGHMRLK